MNRSPSKIDGLLSEKPVALNLERQGRALHGFLQDDFETRERLENLEAGLKSTLLGAGSLEPLISGQLLGAFDENLRQQQADRQRPADLAGEKPGEAIPGGRLDRTISSGRPSEPESGAQRARQDQAPEFGKPGTGPSTVRTSKKGRSRRPESATAGGKFELAAVESKKPGQQAVQKDPDTERKSASKIDARQAGNKLAQRADEAGVGAAWNSVVSTTRRQKAGSSAETNAGAVPAEATKPAPELHHPARDDPFAEKAGKPGSVTGSGKGNEQTTQGLAVSMERLEKLGKDLMGHTSSHQGPTRSSERTGNKVPAAFEHRQTHGPDHSPAGNDIPGSGGNSGPASFDHSPATGGLQNRNEQGGLRGLAARATLPFDDAEGSVESAAPSTRGKVPLPHPGANDAAAGSTSPIAEIADLLAEEARRAGINLEQFRP